MKFHLTTYFPTAPHFKETTFSRELTLRVFPETLMEGLNCGPGTTNTKISNV